VAVWLYLVSAQGHGLIQQGRTNETGCFTPLHSVFEWWVSLAGTSKICFYL